MARVANRNEEIAITNANLLRVLAVTQPANTRDVAAETIAMAQLPPEHDHRCDVHGNYRRSFVRAYRYKLEVRQIVCTVRGQPTSSDSWPS